MKRVLLFFMTLLFIQSLFAQSVKEVEDSVLYYLSNIQKYSSYVYETTTESRNDSLNLYNNTLLNYLNNVLEKQPLTLQAKFERINKLLEKGSSFIKLMEITTSENKNFRIYCWDEQAGGSAHGFYSIVQYKNVEGTRAQIICPNEAFPKDVNGDWNWPGYMYPKIHSIFSKEGKTYYLVIRKGIYSHLIASLGVQCFQIENGFLNDSVKIFKTKNDYLNSIDVDIDYSELKVSSKYPEIRFSDGNTKIYIPLINDNRFDGKYLVYKFDGNNYVFDKNFK